ncbi:MAG TPA: oligosaccharide flippase family protein [Bacteroidales bacterium]|nr:oligosaccharide flippase family protein [Bacteroidales bacterium]
MQRKFLSNLALLLTLNLLVKPFWILGIDRGVQNAVGAEAYGFYFSLLNFSFLFSIILDLGITNFNNRNIAQNAQLLQKHFSGILSIRLVLAVAYLLVTLGTGWLVGYDQLQMGLLAVLGFNQFLSLFILYLRSNISGLMMFRTDSLFSVLDRLLMILVCGVLLWTKIAGEPFRIEWFVFAQTFSYFVVAIIAMGVVVRRSGFRRIRWNLAFSWMILRQSAPFALLILLMTFHNRIDAVMLERLLGGAEGARESGIYASAYRLLDALNQVAWLFAVLLLPLFSRMLKQGDEVRSIVRISFSLLLTVSVMSAVYGMAYSKEIMHLFYREHADQSASVFSLLIWCFIPMSATYVFGTLLTANGSLKYLNIIALAGMAINFGLNLVLIKHMGAKGSAIASLATQLITVSIQVMIAARIFHFTPGQRDWIVFPVFFLLTVLLAFGSRYFLTPSLVVMLFAGMLNLTLAIWMRIIHPSSYRKLIDDSIQNEKIRSGSMQA